MTYHTTEELIGGRSEWAVSPNNFNGLIDSHILANQRISELEAQLSRLQENVSNRNITFCEKCGGTGKDPKVHMSACCPIGHAKECQCALCQWRRRGYELDRKVAALETALQVAREALETIIQLRRCDVGACAGCECDPCSECVASKALARIEEVSRG